MLRLAVLVAAVLPLVACGGAHTAKRCPEQTRALARISHDTKALAHASTAAELSSLTDRFLLHLATAPISNLQRNRLIDHAAAAVATRCPQCFQALEAARPIPAIRQGDVACAATG